MTLDEIETFLCIAQLGSFTEASRQLGRSQPAISRRVHQLEETLGAALFDRLGRRVSLTEAGKVLLPHAESALAAARDAERAIRDLVDVGGAHVLRLAIVGTLADSHLIDALRAFEAEFVDATVELQTATSREVSAFVRNGEANLGLRYFEEFDPALESKLLGAERLYLVVSARHPVRQRRLRTLRKFARERWLGFPPERGQPDSLGQLLERTLSRAGIEDARITRVGSLTAQKRLVEAGLGVALMPRSSVEEELQIGSLRAIEIQGMQLEQPVFAVWRRGGHESPTASAFLKLLGEFTPGLHS
ncbi:MAG: LysR family transcriptional regulator [bacterium]|nr:LysR family transcriptional regulator [bacterium]